MMVLFWNNGIIAVLPFVLISAGVYGLLGKMN